MSVLGMDLPVHISVVLLRFVSAAQYNQLEYVEEWLMLLLQTWPLCFTVNHDNYGYRKPINPLIENLQACEQLYDKTLQLINSKASTRIKGLPS